MTTEPAPEPASTPPARSFRLPALSYVVGGVGVVIGALVVGVLWLTVGGSSSAGGSTEAVTAPAKLGDYQRFAEVPGNVSGPGKSAAERTTAWDRQTAQRLSDAYDGAAATVQTYATPDLRVIFSVQIVRAKAPGLYVPYQDAKTLGLAEPEQDVKTFGAVQCIVHVQPRAAENQTPSQVIATDCQRTGGGLTVRIPAAGGDLGEHPDQVAAVVDEVFNAVN